MICRNIRTAVTLAVLLGAGAASADPVIVRVYDAWSRATPPTAEVGAAYFTMNAEGSGMDRLVGASAPVAERAELHTHVMQGSLMKMRKLDGVDLHPQAPLQFAPGGNHVMLMGLRAPLKEGDRFPLTLSFEKAGAVVVEVTVQGPGAMTAGGHATGTPMHGSDHGSHAPVKAHDPAHGGMPKKGSATQ